MRFIKDNLKNNTKIEKMMSLLKQYFISGGQEVQITVVNAEDLRDSQVHPERYNDLYIKVGGYVAKFIDLSKKEQESIVRRTKLIL